MMILGLICTAFSLNAALAAAFSMVPKLRPTAALLARRQPFLMRQQRNFFVDPLNPFDHIRIPAAANFFEALEKAHEGCLRGELDPAAASEKIFKVSNEDPVLSEVLNLLAHEKASSFENEFMKKFCRSNAVEDAFEIVADAKGKTFLSVRNGLAEIRHVDVAVDGSCSTERIIITKPKSVMRFKQRLPSLMESIWWRFRKDKETPASLLGLLFNLAVNNIEAMPSRKTKFKSYKNFGFIQYEQCDISVEQYCQGAGLDAEECEQFKALLSKLN